MYGKPFNEKRPYGTVHGEANHVYEQDGFLYNGQKQCVDADGKLIPMPSKAIEAEPSVEVIVPADNPDDDIPDDEKPFDVLAWAQGDETLKATPWTKVKAEAAMLLGDATGLSSKEAARKAILAHYGISA